MYSSKFWHYVQPEWWQKRVKNIHQFLYSPQIHFLPLSLQTLYAFANRTLVRQFLTSSREHWLGVQGGQSARVWLMEFSVVFCVQNVLPFSLCGQKMRSAPWLASTRPPDRVSLTPVDLWRASTIRWDPRTEMMKIIWRIMIKKWEKSYYLMIMTVIMIPSLSLLSLTPVEDSLVILTPPMSICQYFAKNDALQQKQCIATFFGKSLWISYPLSLSQKIIWSYKRPIIYLSLLENQAVCKRASASHQRNITATPHATHNIQIDYGKSVPWVHLE